jgi:lipopolysaccharide transport system permease protein
VRGQTADSWIENRPRRGVFTLDLDELWAYRELAAVLAIRDLKVRYKQAAFGVAWAVIQPLAGMVVFTIIFGRLADLPSDGVPYAVFSFVGLAVWNYHSTVLSQASLSLVNNASLVTKVYFPRVLAPLAATLPGLVDLGIALCILGVLLVLYDTTPSWGLLTLPLATVCLVATALGVSLWLAAVNVRYRDIKYGVNLLVQLWLFASPVTYPSSLVEGQWRILYYANPMAGIIDWFRWALVGTPAPGRDLALSLAVTAVVLAGGLAYFQRAERRFADVI